MPHPKRHEREPVPAPVPQVVHKSFASQVVAKISVVCWGLFLTVFWVIVALQVIPVRALPIVSFLSGLVAIGIAAVYFVSSFRTRGAHVSPFAERAWWLTAAFGVGALGLGGFALLLPAQFQSVSGAEGLAFAKVAVVVFWLALIATFLGYAIICFSEMGGYVRLKDNKSAGQCFALGVMWLVFAVPISHLFLNLVDEVFVPIAAPTHHAILIAIACGALLGGVAMSGAEDLEMLARKRSATGVARADRSAKVSRGRDRRVAQATHVR